MKKLFIIVVCLLIMISVTGCDHIGTGLGIDENGKIVPLEDVNKNKVEVAGKDELKDIERADGQEIKPEDELVEENVLYNNTAVQYGGTFWDAVIPAGYIPITYFNNDVSDVSIDRLTEVTKSLVSDFNIEVKDDISIFKGDISESVTLSSDKGLAMALVRNADENGVKVLEIQAKVASDKPIENIDVLNEVIKDKIGIDVSLVDGFKGAIEKVYNAEYDYAKVSVNTQKRYEYFTVAATISKGEENTYEYIIDLCIEL